MSDVQNLDSQNHIISVQATLIFALWDGSQRSAQSITEALTEWAGEVGARMITARNQGRVSMIDGGTQDSRFVVEFERLIDKRVLRAEVAPHEFLVLTTKGFLLIDVEAMPAAGTGKWFDAPTYQVGSPILRLT